MRQRKQANPETHKREHERFLVIVRHEVSMAILDAASRSHKITGGIDYDAPSLIEQHGGGPVYSAIRIRSTNAWLFGHPLFRQIADAVRAEEDRERSLVVTSESRQKTAATVTTAVLGAIGPQLDAIQQRVQAAPPAPDAVREATIGRIAYDAATAGETVQLGAIAELSDLRVRVAPSRFSLRSRAQAQQMGRSGSAPALQFSFRPSSPPSLPGPSAPPSSRSSASAVTGKRKRRADGPGEPQQNLADLGVFRGFSDSQTIRPSDSQDPQNSQILGFSDPQIPTFHLPLTTTDPPLPPPA